MRWIVCRSKWIVCRRARGGHFGLFAVYLELSEAIGTPTLSTLAIRIITRRALRLSTFAGLIHISTSKLTPAPQTPHPRLPPPVFRSLFRPDRRGHALRARHLQPVAMPLIFACAIRTGLATRPAPLPPNGHSTTRGRHRFGGAARQAHDDRRHGDAGHLRLRDTAPEVGEGGARSGIGRERTLGAARRGVPRRATLSRSVSRGNRGPRSALPGWVEQRCSPRTLRGSALLGCRPEPPDRRLRRGKVAGRFGG